MSNVSEKVLLDVHGMWCTSCARALEKALINTPGVSLATVNFSSGGAAVEFDSGRTSLDNLVKVASALGYPLAPADDAHGMHALELEKQLKRLQSRLIISVFLSMWIMLPQWVIYFDPSAFNQSVASSLGWLGFALNVPLIFYGGGMFLRAGWRTLRVGAPGMDTLVSIGSLSSLVLSGILLLNGQPYALYLDTGSTLVVLLLIARYIDMRVRAQAGDAVRALTSSIPQTAWVLLDGLLIDVPTKNLKPGDTVRLQPGDTVQGDGVVIAGISELDQSFLTGENSPNAIAPGDRVAAGSINLYAMIDYQIDTAIGQRRIDLIVQSVRQLISQKGQLQALTDVWSMRLTMAIVPLALLTGALLWLQGGDGLAVAQRMLAVIVVTCPCALSLAIPLAFRMAAARAVEDGSIIRHSHAVERASWFDCVVFDKTGTLTVLRHTVEKMITTQDVDPMEMLLMAASLAKTSQHHMALAVVNKAKKENVSLADLVWRTTPTETAGRGIDAVAVDGTQWFLGRPLHNALTTDADDVAMSSVQLRRNDVPMLTCYVLESVRIEAAALIKILQHENMKTWLASGDHTQAVLRCARAVGIAEAQCRAHCLPDDKAALIKQLQAQGLRVVFVGDGINDAPAMAAADLSIAVQGANRIAQTSASVVMTRGDLLQLLPLIKAVRSCRRRMQQNLWWAVLYNIAALPAAVFGWISPSMAAAAMVASSLSVTINSARAHTAQLHSKKHP
ncbi:MAG: cation-translocating P-type ATPase [Polaromonas sp.]